MTYTVVTGARGYIGRALASRLAHEGRTLRLVSRFAGQYGDEIVAPTDFVQADLRDQGHWRALLQRADAVIHLSARTDLRAAEADPAADYELNVAPVRALVEAAGRCNEGLPVIFASTVTIVGERHTNPVNEMSADRPCSVYDRHKLECEMVLGEATRRGIVTACSLRLSNVHGYSTGAVAGSVNAHRGVLNAVMARAARGEPLLIYGDGNYLRDFIFIDDVADAFCRALDSEQLRDGSHYIVATGCGYTLAQAFELVAEAAFLANGRRPQIRHVPEPANMHPIERRNFVGDASLFRRLSGWRAQVDLPSGIGKYFGLPAPIGRSPN